MKHSMWILMIVALVVISLVIRPASSNKIIQAQGEKETMNSNEKVIYLAGGCFWGVEEYFARIEGVLDSESGYANGKVEATSYELLSRTGHAETVKVTYDQQKINLANLLQHYFRIIDPTSVNKQGNDIGTQYRTGIYYTDPSDEATIKRVMAAKATEIGEPLAVELEPLKHYVMAEGYHQDYLKKNPNGYCHINLNDAEVPLIDPAKYPKPDDETLKAQLSPEEYAVTQLNDTERAFSNRYWDNVEPGIYVDVATGEPLFASTDKFESGCGWPSFTHPIVPEVVTYQEDMSFNMKRVEVRSRSGNSHLGHVFEDGPKELGGLRYCINSASIRFVPKDKMAEQGYDYLLGYVK